MFVRLVGNNGFNRELGSFLWEIHMLLALVTLMMVFFSWCHFFLENGWVLFVCSVVKLVGVVG